MYYNSFVYRNYGHVWLKLLIFVEQNRNFHVCGILKWCLNMKWRGNTTEKSVCSDWLVERDRMRGKTSENWTDMSHYWIVTRQKFAIMKAQCKCDSQQQIYLVYKVHGIELTTTMNCNVVQLIPSDHHFIETVCISTWVEQTQTSAMVVFELGLNENKLIQVLWQQWSNRNERRRYYMLAKHTNTNPPTCTHLNLSRSNIDHSIRT